MKNKKEKNIQLISVDLGDITIRLPVATLTGTTNETVLITAGLDGDEYTGIEAAYELIDIYKKRPHDQTLIILPLVNLPGFMKGISANPLDEKYPKYVLPGKVNGSPTERLMAFVYSYAKSATLWIDLHSGARNEKLDPFILTSKTRRDKLNQRVIKLLRALRGNMLIYEQKNGLSFSDILAKTNTAYLLLESGELGLRRIIDRKRHVSWVSTILSELSSKRNRTRSVLAYTATHIYKTHLQGVWKPLAYTTSIQKKQELGNVYSLENDSLKKILAKEHGVFLWGKVDMPLSNGETLIATASNKKPL